MNSGSSYYAGLCIFANSHEYYLLTSVVDGVTPVKINAFIKIYIKSMRFAIAQCILERKKAGKIKSFT